jgi:restriction system protein
MSPTPTPGKPPKLSDFGLTEDVVSSSREIIGTSNTGSRFGEGRGFVWGVMLFFFLIFVTSTDFGVLGSLGMALFVGLAVGGTIYILWDKFCEIHRNKNPDYAHAHAVENLDRHAQFKKAQEAYEEAQRRKKADYWAGLSGIDFEHEIASLYDRHGYRTEVTPGSGDQGIDIIMHRDTEKVIVQCKNHRNPVGPAVVRELFGVLAASDAQSAILICTGGFTKGVHEFARGKPITLLDIDDILELEQNRRK